MKFKIGDRVRITGTGLERLNLNWRYLWTGVIVGVRTNATDPYVFAVLINEAKSDGSFCIGTHHFSEDELQSVVSYKDAIRAYVDTDIAATRSAYERHNELNNTIINVIFNDPATIVFWYDGTKTVVKAQEGDTFDPEKGLAMAITKKFMGNKGNYCNELKKWLPKEEELGLCTMADLENIMIRLGEAMSRTFGVSERKKKYNPVQKAYDILVRARDGKNENTIDYDELIGYLGEALNG